jgi:hypothetical protein
MLSRIALLLAVILAGCSSDPPAPRQTERVNERTREWIRGGTKELGEPSPDSGRGKGFGPEALPNPAPQPKAAR